MKPSVSPDIITFYAIDRQYLDLVGAGRFCVQPLISTLLSADTWFTLTFTSIERFIEINIVEAFPFLLAQIFRRK